MKEQHKCKFSKFEYLSIN